MALYLFLASLRSSSFSEVGFDFHSMNAFSLDLTASAHVLLNQERSFGLIDLFLLGIYIRIPSKIMFETISAAESMFLSKKHKFQLNLSKNSFNARQSALT